MVNWDEPGGVVSLGPNEIWEMTKGMRKVRCEYCGQLNNGETRFYCSQCGAELPETNHEKALSAWWSTPVYKMGLNPAPSSLDVPTNRVLYDSLAQNVNLCSTVRMKFGR